MFASLLCVSGSPFKALTTVFTTVKNIYPLVALYNIKLFCCAGSDELYETTVLLQFSQIHYSRRNLDQAYHSYEVIFGSMALSVCGEGCMGSSLFTLLPPRTREALENGMQLSGEH